MARPAKSVSMQSDSTRIANAEKRARQEAEDEMRGASDKLHPPENFPERRKQIFRETVGELSERGILGNLDYYVLVKFATAVDMMERIDEIIEADMEEIENAKLRNAREMYSRDFFKCCTELCLSPASRAKSAIVRAENEKKPPSVFDIIGADDEDKD